MAIEFENAILAGVTLVREAIQSQNYQAGTSGWQIAADGSAEFADLLIRSSDGSSRYIELENGALILTNGTVIYAEAGLALGATNDPGFVAYAAAGRRYYALLSSGFVEFGEDGAAYDAQPIIEHVTTAGGDPSTLSLSSGYVGNATAFEQAVIDVIGAADGSTNPRIEMKTSAGGECDVEISGTLTAGNRITGTTSIVPVAGVPTSKAIVFPAALTGSSFTCQVTANTSVPGTTVTGVGYTALSSTGVTLWVTRSNNTATTLSYTVEGQ